MWNPYGPGESEYAAGQVLLRRAVASLGPRFADYGWWTGNSPTAPFLHALGDLHLPVVARLKGNLPELFQAAQKRFQGPPPKERFQEGATKWRCGTPTTSTPGRRLRWNSVRVLRYRQHKPDGTVCEAFWLTDFPTHQLSKPLPISPREEPLGDREIKASTTPRIAMA